MDIDALLEGLSDEEDGGNNQIEALLDAPEDLALCLELDNSISVLYDKISEIYQDAAPELVRIVPDKIIYCKVVQRLGTDPTVDTDLTDIVSKQTAMAIRLSPLQCLQTDSDLQDCNLVDKLVAKRQAVLDNTIQSLSYGNLLAIISRETCAQLLAYTGSLEALASTPSANIPSLGSNQRAARSGAARQGILWNDPIFKGVDAQHMRSATRVVAGKLVLAARCDIANPSDPSNGIKWAAYITERLDKLGAPPPNKLDKALPIPTEFKAKVRGGKRARKHKEKYQMSEMHKQSKRIGFGVPSEPSENTISTSVVRDSAPSQLELSKKLRERLSKS